MTILIDYKTTAPAADHVKLYTRQLHSYALALEYPERKSLHLSPVTTIGIMSVDPVEMVDFDRGGAFRLETTWIPIEKDYVAFKLFLTEVFSVLDAAVPPMANPDCRFCEYREITVKEWLL